MFITERPRDPVHQARADTRDPTSSLSWFHIPWVSGLDNKLILTGRIVQPTRRFRAVWGCSSCRCAEFGGLPCILNLPPAGLSTPFDRDGKRVSAVPKPVLPLSSAGSLNLVRLRRSEPGRAWNPRPEYKPLRARVPCEQYSHPEPWRPSCNRYASG